MKSKSKIIQSNIFWSLLALCLLVLLWYLAAIIYDKPFILPQPYVVFEETGRVLTEKSFYLYFLESLKRCFYTLIISFILALVLALLSVFYRPFYKLLLPVISVARAVPTMSVIFILILVLSPKTTPIFVTLLVVMPSIYSMLISAFIAIPKDLIECGRVFGFNKIDEVRKIYLPLSLPSMIESISSGFSLSFKILIAAEALASTAGGLAHLLTLAKIDIQMPRIFAITLLMIVFCILIELVFRFLHDKVSKSIYQK